MTNTRTDPYAERDARAAHLGWTYVSDRSCPRRLLGKRCKVSTRRAPSDRCWCENGLNVHGGTWRDNPANRNQQFVLWQPYGADGDDLADVIAVARQDGLQVRIDSSVWNPEGRGTVGIRFVMAER